MKKTYVFIICCLSVLLHACSNNTIDTEPAVKDKPVTTIFNFRIDQPADLQPVAGTRSDASVDESTAEDTTIKDINLFIWDPNDISSLQLIYQDNAENAVVALAPGKYQIRIIANVGYKLDISIFKDFPGILDYFHDDNLQRPDTKYYIFAAAKEIEIRPGQPQTEEIELVRLFARIYLEISLDDNLTNLTLHSAQVCNIPSSAALFGPPDNSDNYPEAGQCYVKSHVKAATENKISDVVYVYENVKPANLNITDQTQRNTDNAPDGATYVHIIAYETGSTNAYSYYVYLGQNNTTDFSVRRNTSTQYNIVIKGINEVDLRVQKVFATVVHYGDIHTDLKTWPITETNSFCEIGRYTVTGIKAEDEGKCFAKTPAEYYSFDYGKTWQANDNTTPIPMVSNGKARTIQLRKIVTGPGARPVEPIEFLYGDPEAPTPIKLVTYPPTRYCEYKIKFQIDGLDNYSDFRIKTFLYNSTYGTVGMNSYSTTGQFMLVAFPSAPDSAKDAITLSFSWKSGYKFLGFQDEQGNIFNCGTTSGNSWSNSPGLYSSLFWREHNQGSGYIYLKFEKETPPEPQELIVTTTSISSGIAHKPTPFSIKIANSGSLFAGNIAITQGTGILKRDDTELSNNFNMTSGENKFSFIPTCIGEAAFAITVKNISGNSKTLSYKMNVDPLQITVTHYWQPESLYAKTLNGIKYHEPYKLLYYATTSEAVPIDVNFTYSLTYTSASATGKAKGPTGDEYVVTTNPNTSTKTGTVSIKSGLLQSKSNILDSFTNEVCYNYGYTSDRPVQTYINFYKTGTFISTEYTYWTITPNNSPDNTIVYTHQKIGCQHKHTFR